MSLNKYYGKNVRIVAENGRMFEGKVTDYIYPEDNVPEEVESIIIRCLKGRFPGKSIEFTAPEIKSIEILE